MPRDSATGFAHRECTAGRRGELGPAVTHFLPLGVECRFEGGTPALCAYPPQAVAASPAAEQYRSVFVPRASVYVERHLGDVHGRGAIEPNFSSIFLAQRTQPTRSLVTRTASWHRRFARLAEQLRLSDRITVAPVHLEPTQSARVWCRRAKSRTVAPPTRQWVPGMYRPEPSQSAGAT